MPVLIKNIRFDCLKSFSDSVIIGKKAILSDTNIQSLLQPFADKATIRMALLRQATTSLIVAERNVDIISLRDQVSKNNAAVSARELVNEIRSIGLSCKKVGFLFICQSTDEIMPFLSALVRSFPSYSEKTHPKVPEEISFSIVDSNLKEFSQKTITMLISALQIACELIDNPPNKITPNELESLCVQVASRNPCTGTDIVRGDELLARGLCGIYHVGKASRCPPRLITLTHEGTPGVPFTAIVGKGITYDAGGLCLKKWQDLHGMKSDMAGAAVALVAFEAAINLVPHINLHAILCIAENAIGPESLRPDEVIKLYSGKSVEVVNTDSEGRLVLGDGVAYADKTLHANTIIDIATLTSTQPLSTGTTFASIVSNCDDLGQAAVEAGRVSGDLVWPLPYCPEIFAQEFASEIADMTNSTKVRETARTACAAQFIANHINLTNKRWLHCDMLAPARFQNRATGFGVFLLLQLLCDVKAKF